MKCGQLLLTTVVLASHPARGAWIEIFYQLASHTSSIVAPRKGCVD